MRTWRTALRSGIDALSRILRLTGSPTDGNRQAETPSRCHTLATTPRDPPIFETKFSQSLGSPPNSSAPQGGIDQTAGVRDKSKFRSNLFQWPVARSTRAFRVFVVEPNEYRPEIHSLIFDAAITALLNPERTRADPYSATRAPSSIEHFDLITFPEAFLPQEALLSALRQLSHLDSIGCVHVGLRPRATGQHLFSVQELQELVLTCVNQRNGASGARSARFLWSTQRARQSGCSFE